MAVLSHGGDYFVSFLGRNLWTLQDSRWAIFHPVLSELSNGRIQTPILGSKPKPYLYLPVSTENARLEIQDGTTDNGRLHAIGAGGAAQRTP
jgi:hypothetical protein